MVCADPAETTPRSSQGRTPATVRGPEFGIFGFPWLLAALLVTCFSWTSALGGTPTAKVTWVSSGSASGRQVILKVSDDAPDDDNPLNKSFGVGGRLFTRSEGEAQVVIQNISSNNLVRVGPLSELRLASRLRSPLDLVRGAFYFLARGEPLEFEFVTPHLIGGHSGTDFAVTVTETETTITLFDGRLDLTNRFTGKEGMLETVPVTLTNRFQQAILRTNHPPAVLLATNVVQWWLRYPAVLDPGELPDDVREPLAPSIAAYARGNLEAARRELPVRSPVTDGERIYRAMLEAGAGRIPEANTLLGEVHSLTSLSNSIALMIHAITRVSVEDRVDPQTASEWLGNSYLLQAQNDLPGALRAARQALERSPKFSYARIRLAELEFGRGNWPAARKLLDESPVPLDQNAGAESIRGFIALASREPHLAQEDFQRALELDPSLGEAWLGEGLRQIRKGSASDLAGGVRDLQTAAAAEPNRAQYRSYLGKGYQVAGQQENAEKELNLAIELDPRDPTPWLYMALLRQEENRINEAISALTESLELNDNRLVYRSQLMLDEDRAVRSANLARMYEDAGMDLIAIREASRALEADYQNASAHFFLSNSYNSLRDPGQADLRYETAWYSELLVGNLLSPVGAGQLSPTLSANEYGLLFERNRPFSMASTTRYLDFGWVEESAAVRGLFERSEYAVEMYYLRDPGLTPNTDVETWSVSPRFKHQLGTSDTLLLEASFSQSTVGDRTRQVDPDDANREFRGTERIEPVLLAGLHHEWSPEQDTLVLVGGFRDTYSATDPSFSPILFTRNTSTGEILDLSILPAVYPGLTYNSRFEGITLDLQHVAALTPGQSGALGRHTLIVGGRGQMGRIRTDTQLESGKYFVEKAPGSYWTDPAEAETRDEFDRATVYAYDQLQLGPRVSLTLGISFDWLEYPLNFRVPPLNGASGEESLWAPKVGLNVVPWTNGVVRLAYFQSMGGVAFDQSFRLEPTQVAGFNQAYRSLIPESVAGPLTAPIFQTVALGLDQRVGRKIFFTSSFAWNQSDAIRQNGGLNVTGIRSIGSSDYLDTEVELIQQDLNYQQWQAGAGLFYLLDDQWTLGMNYAFDQVELEGKYSGAGDQVRGFEASRRTALFQQIGPQLAFNAASGWFARVQALYWDQDSDFPGAGDSLWKVDLMAGYRLFSRRLEISAGVLNVLGEDYRFDPLTLYPAIPRGRAYVFSLRFWL